MTYQKDVGLCKLFAHDSTLLLLKKNHVPLMYIPVHPFPDRASFYSVSEDW